MEYSNLFVCLMGMGTVFFGLIALILLVSVMSGIVRKTDEVMKKSEGTVTAPEPAAPDTAAVTPELIAAVSAAIAEETGKDISAIRIVSFRKV